MLRFVYGRSASGKSYHLMQQLQAGIETGKDIVFFVPEQFSFDTEKAIVKQFGDLAAANVTVLSFTRLCDELERLLGGACIRQLSPAGKLILMNRTLRQTADQLKIWGKQARSVGFCNTLLESIEEFKSESILPEQLRKIGEYAGQPRLAAKLHDISLIYDCYNGLITRTYIDPTDRLTRAYDLLEDCRYFENKTVFIDSFKGFSGQQYRILERILTQADEVSIALTLDPSQPKRYDLFQNVRNTAEKLKRIAAAHHIAIEEECLLKPNPKMSTGLVAVEQILSGKKPENVPIDSNVTVCAAQSIFDEAEFAARSIRKLVRESGYRYRDFVVITRDTATYEEAFWAACKKNDVDCFMDRRTPLTDFPPVVAVLSAFSVAERISTEAILRFHKSGVGVLSLEEISELERYCKLWNINGKTWLTDWDMNPNGLQSENEICDREILNRLNTLRRRTMDPLVKFRNDFCGTATQRGTAIMELFRQTHAAESFKKLQQQFAEIGDHAQADALSQSYDLLVDILDDLAICFGSESPENDEYCKAFITAVTLTTVGIAPQTLDEVSFGAADRIRPARPKIAIVLGCNQGVFPRPANTGGLFGIADRSDMIDLGLEISDCSISEAIDENFLVYTNLCCATDRLFLCYSLRNAKQEEANPSPFVEQIVQILGCTPLLEPQQDLTLDSLPETSDAAFSVACERLQHQPQSATAFFDALNGENYLNRTARIREAVSDSAEKITHAQAKSLYGTQLRISASSLETYHKCKFQYFCKYGLRAKKIQPADFDAMQRGTLIHYVLQRIFEMYGEQIGTLSDAVIDTSVDTCVESYLNNIPGFSSVRTPYIQVLIDNMTRTSKEIVRQMRDEFAQSDFKPCAFEFKFGLDGKDPVCVSYDQGKILLNGSVDRVDTWNGYIRIIDYKTGKKEFRLPDILVGQNLQMLLYLYAITRGGEFEAMRNAGIFYVPARRDRGDDGLAMKGLMSADEDLVHAMEKENAGRFIPQYRLTKSGTLNQYAEKNFINETDFSVIFDYIERLLNQTGNGIISGDIAVDPIDSVKTDACKYCDFASVCGIEDKAHKKAEDMKNSAVIETISAQKEAT